MRSCESGSDLAFLPVIKFVDESMEGSNAKDDDEVPANRAVLDTEMGVDHERVLKFLAADGNGVHDAIDRFEVEARDGKGDVNLEKIPEDAEAGIEHDVA